VARFGSVGEIPEALVLCEDAAEGLKQVPAGSVDLVVTSPPYYGVSDYMKAQRLSMEWFGYEIEPLRLREIGARSKRHRISAYEEYIVQLEAAFKGARRCLRPGGHCVVVIGESSTRESVLEGVKKALKSCGFDLELDLNRRVPSQRRQAPSIKGEHVFVLSA
jgi:DNA modification methylase